MHRSRPFIFRALAIATIGCVSACRSSPTEVARLDGVFPLAAWDGLPLPVNLGAFPPSTCATRIQSGALTLKASSRSFTYTYEMRDCQEFVVDAEREDGFYVQNEASIDFVIPEYGRAADLHFTGDMQATRIVIANGDPQLEFLRPR
jgi:hypothetical protein